ncbi:GNAT family N-acetyltransferase [Cytobacillus solani]|uniref:GNAT family acetyltransferase n=1 Tax=Cytobacillus solani TaxID=1637975 RepID=A0A0Q3VGD0_9BACI|nr:GNAT family protein [Cytobacillus solani]KOP78236.1 GNAT family acetyltransferase [Bacillus sp. FJAT-21945]KQL17735.1 GNAT family acetyltransferase [Cytobacillus solani]USK55543.1 GNAT family N-acetyltransferase [Cytobacillus solani]
MGFIQPKHFVNNKGEPYTVRTALPEDAEKVLRFNQTIISEAPFLLTTEAEFKVSYEQQKQFIKQIFDDNGKLAIVAEYQNNIIGFLDFHNGHKKRIQHQGSFGMSVADEFRNQGVGNAMLSLLLAWAKENPLIEKVCLEVFAENTNAISLYAKVGFVEEGRKVKAIKVNEDIYYDLISMTYFTK